MLTAVNGLDGKPAGPEDDRREFVLGRERLRHNRESRGQIRIVGRGHP